MENDPWVRTSWGNLVELKYGKSLKGYKDATGEVPVFGTNGPVGWCDQPLCDFPSVIVGRKGAYRGIHYSDRPFYVIDTAFFVVPKTDINLKWAYYSLLTQDINGMDSGSAIPSTSREDFYALQAHVPPRPIQDFIVEHLDAFNGKIELNRQMNATLESMAQALFKSWFVDFDPVIDNALEAGNPIPEPLQARADRRKALGDQRKPLPEHIQSQFPSSFVFSDEMGWVPEGWEIKEAQDIASISIGKTPPRKESHWFSDELRNNVRWASIRDMGNSGVFIGDTSEYLVPESISKFNVIVIPQGSVILSFKLTLGRVAIAQTELTTNEAIAHFVNPQCGLSKEYIFSYLNNFDYGRLGSTSSIATAVNSKLIKAMPFLVPEENVLASFEIVTESWFLQISKITDQIQTLEKLRDTLLPKLLSGDLRIPDAEKQLAEAP